MFTENDLYEYLEQHQLPEKANEYIRKCYFGEPSRLVGVHAKDNVVSYIPSQKLGNKTFSVESGSAERSLHTLKQFDDEMFWYGDQPPRVEIIKTDKNGRKFRSMYTPDALGITKSGPIIYEAKTRDDIEKLLIKNPKDWIKVGSGKIIYKPARDALKKIGIPHVVYVYETADQILVNNLNQILWVRENNDIDRNIKKSIKKVMEENFVLTLSELKKELKLKSYTAIIKGLDEGLIVSDLKNQLIMEPESCLVSSSLDLLEHGKELRFGNQVYWKGLIHPIEIIKVPSKKEADKVLKRLKQITSGVKNRSVRRWETKIKNGIKNGLSKFQSLISDYSNCGKSSDLELCVQNYLIKFLNDEYLGSNSVSIYGEHGRYMELAEKKHPDYSPVCIKTFNRYLLKIPPDKRGLSQGGIKLRNAMSYPSDPEKRNLKATAAWERSAIDHCLLKIFLIVYTKDGEIIVERPWLTLMIDLYSGEVLGFSISFEKPSRKSVARVLRQCVRRHGKLPREIIVDRGAEFKSVYLAGLLAHYEVILSLRPAGHSRYGGLVELFFAEFLRQWISQRPGNMANYKNARAVDGSKAPRKSAILRPVDAIRELNVFIRWRSNKCKGIGDSSSAVKFDQSCEEYPYISLKVNYDAEFIVATCIETGDYTINLQKGINVKNIWYSSPALQLISDTSKKYEVRLDPENPNLIFVKIREMWEPFYSSDINVYATKLEEFQIAEGIIKHEAAYLRDKIRKKDRIKLARLLREMNENRDSETYSVIEVEEDELDENVDDELIGFSKFKTSSMRPIKIESWGHNNG